ncbi:MAG TPA: methyl-accepting chemotaxis protein [Methanospirillum sp.]|nr:methyl-accepting chemotaxis protein [Methanospirillum sp.]
MKFTGLDSLLSSDLSESEKLKILAHQYNERVKEQQLIQKAAVIVNDTSLTLEDSIRKVLKGIPGAWQFPEICGVRFVYKDMYIQTDGYDTSEWSQKTTIATSDREEAILEVVYTEERPESDEGPFLKEERQLLNALGGILAGGLNRNIMVRDIEKKVEESLFHAKKSEFIITNAPTPIFEVGIDYNIINTNRAFSDLTGLSSSELVGKSIKEITVLEREGRTIEDSIAEKTKVTGELVMDVPAGKKSARYTYIPLLDQHLQVVSLINFYQDRTAEKDAVQEIINLTGEAKLGKLDSRVDVSRFSGEFKVLAEGFNQTLDAVIGPLNVAAEYVDRIAKGDIPPKITEIYSGDFNEIKNNLNLCIDAINHLVADAGLLSDAAVKGRLDTRADATRHQGDFRKIVEGVNQTLDAVIGPLNVAAEYVDRISKGDIPPKIADSYNGDFNEIKNNLNQCIDAVNLLIGDAHLLSEAAIKGKLITRADASKHLGDFRKIVEGVNETLDAVIDPLNVAAQYVDRISKGDIPPKITDSYNGDFNEIKNNLNQCIDAISFLVRDAEILSEAAVNGKLGTRADATKHQGDFRRIVDGVNHTLDAVIGPLNVAAGYVDRISKGDIPPKITDAYNGDFNEIKNNLNLCIEAVNSLIRDATALSEAAIKGKLATRADSTKHQGDFRKIVEGVNDTLDAVIGPLNVAAKYVDRISKGDMPPRITDTYNGDFNEIKSNLNTCIDAVNLLVSDAGLLSDAAVKGKLDTRADYTKHQGDFRKIVEGVNNTLDAVIGPLNVAAEYVDRISKGDIPPKISETYNGDFNEIKNNLNTCIDAVNLLVSDAKMLADAAVKGKLDTRADATKHQGDFQVVVKGVNETLDSVIGPLNVAAEYVDRISKGDIPPRITDTYNGDFNEIKNNLNTCIDAVNLLVSDAKLLADAAVKGKLDTRADATKHQGDFQAVVKGVNETLDAVIGPLNVAAEYVDRISKGDIPPKITDSYNGDFNEIKNNLNTCISAVNLLVSDAKMLADAAVKGKLDTRADATKHQGDFQAVVKGVNETLDSVIGPLNVAAEYVDRISKGDIPPRITDTYNGDFNEIKNNLNTCIDAVNLLVSDAKMLADAAVKGKLDTRADATKHQGDFQAVVKGVNETLDSVIGPLNVAAEYVDRISKGDIPPRITDTYNGDFNEIKNNLNTCIDAVNLLVSDAKMLADAAVKGKLDTRADATKHQGDFQAVVKGVNETLDSVIGPLNVAAEYVDRISKGDIPPRITDSYNGDFNEIKNNLNQCIDAVNLMVDDAVLLSEAAVKGALDTRADATKHQGDFRKIVEGVNQTLNAVIGPLNVAAEYVDRISKGDIPPQITDSYNGDFNEIKNNLNTCIDAVNLLVTDAKMLAEAAIKGALDTRADATKHQGDFQVVVKGVNETLDAVIGPLNVAAEYVDRISKGDIPPQITDSYNGDFNEIKNNLNTCIGAVNLLVSDAKMLSDAAVKGALDTRADATRHQGDFQIVVKGVNETLDAVIGPLNVAAEYVDRISKGDIPPQITDSYNGDFNEIKNNLNQCIDAVNFLVSDAAMLSDAAVKGKLDTRADATRHQGDFRKIVEGVNETLDAVIGPLNVAAEYVDRISKGDIPPQITDSYNGDFNEIKNNLNTCIGAVNLLVSDAKMLSDAAVKGALDTRADATRHQGDFQIVVKGVNETLDAVIGPLNVAAEYVDRISKGDIPPQITDSYNGDFNEIKNNLNQCIDAVNFLVSDAAMLSDAAVKGKLDTRADAARHQGDFRKIVEGVNQTLDAVIGPLNVAAEYVDRISKGDIPPKITDSYNGDFNEIKNNLNQCIDAVNLLVADASMLSGAAVKGALDTRADATRHQGDFRKIVDGVNQTLDAVIGPLNVAAEYVDRISKGDIPPKITDSYNGDFNEIKNNLNQCIDAVNLLVRDAGMLSGAAIKGQLDTRADAARHQGDFRKIVDGVNQTLDAVILPLKEAMRMANEFASANFSARVDENLQVAGDYIVFKNSLNSIGIQIQGAIKEIQRIADQYASGNFAAEFDRTLQISGDLATLKDGLNAISTDVSEVLSVVNSEMIHLKGQASHADRGIQDVSNGAGMIAKNADQTKMNAERSEDGITQVLRTMEDLTRTVSDVSSNAERVAELSHEANGLAKKGIGFAGRADDGMQSITRTSEQVDSIITEIRSQMNEIGKIVDLISDLANQTNLLSLNAAIEAARAGDAGRGFAVVAAEVKSLAQRSRQSAEHIADMISGLQKKSEQASTAMADAGKAVADGSIALTDTLSVFNQLSTSVEDITKNMEMVASATEEQAASFEEITASVNEMSNLVKETSKDALNSSATSEEALAVVDQITEVISEINRVVGTINNEMSRFTFKETRQ